MHTVQVQFLDKFGMSVVLTTGALVCLAEFVDKVAAMPVVDCVR